MKETTESQSNESFSIHAKTMNFGEFADSVPSNPEHRFVVPIYQRPYSWGEEQLERLWTELLESWRSDDDSQHFLGTIQLSAKSGDPQDVIDGQQRLTSCGLLAVALAQAISPDNATEMDWLETRVNGEMQQSLLEEALALSSAQDVEACETNRYHENLHWFRDQIGELLKEEEGVASSVLDHLLEKALFVVIETNAGLSKTLEIFDRINTAGLSLDAGDVFKIRLYEYLTRICKQGDNVFEEIAALYGKIDEKNHSRDTYVCTITDILDIYRFILIGRYGLPTGLEKLGTSRFYEDLFETLLNGKIDSRFSAVTGLEIETPVLRIEDLDKIIDQRFAFDLYFRNMETNGSRAETRFAYYLIWWSRYNRWFILLHVARFTHPEEEEESHSNLALSLARLALVYSICFGKQINPVRTFLVEQIVGMVDHGGDIWLSDVADAIGENVSKDWRKGFIDTLNDQILWPKKRKALLCRLSEWLATPTDQKTHKHVDTIFGENKDAWPLEIEHIEPTHHSDEELRPEIEENWAAAKVDRNGLGNLMLLEMSINRSISNLPHRKKNEEYSKSVFSIPGEISTTNSKNWTTELAKEKLDRDVKAIAEFVFGDDQSTTRGE